MKKLIYLLIAFIITGCSKTNSLDKKEDLEFHPDSITIQYSIFATDSLNQDITLKIHTNLLNSLSTEQEWDSSHLVFQWRSPNLTFHKNQVSKYLSMSEYSRQCNSCKLFIFINGKGVAYTDYSVGDSASVEYTIP